MKYKIAFLGTPKFAAQILENLIGSPFKPSLVITGQPKKTGRSLALAATPVELVAKKNNIKASYKLSLVDNSFDLAILVAYGKIIPDNVLRAPKFGFLNVHPSLLPKYRGPSPITSAILAGEKVSGVSLMVLDSEIDHGPLIAQEEIAISEDDTNESLTEKLSQAGSNLLIKTLPEYLNQNLTPEAQNHNEATYTEKITKKSGKIDLNSAPDKAKLDAMIRAFYPWPGVWFEIGGKRFKLLPGNKIQPEGKRPLSTIDFKNGYRELAEKIKNLIG